MRTTTVIVPIGNRGDAIRLSRVAAEAAHVYDAPTTSADAATSTGEPSIIEVPR